MNSKNLYDYNKGLKVLKESSTTFPNGSGIILNEQPMEFEWFPHGFQMDLQTIMNRFPKDFEQNSTGV